MVRSHQEAKRIADEYLRAEGSTLVAKHATHHRAYDVWLIDYRDPDYPDEPLTGGELVVTSDGHVHSIGSTPDALDALMVKLGRWPLDIGELPWPGVLDDEFSKAYFRDLMELWMTGLEICPAQNQVFEAFRLTPFEAVKVVIVGQDPYPNPKQAMGLAFSVPRGVQPLPASLRNIYEAMRADGFTPPQHGDLTDWAKQGVLLMNTALTVPRGGAGEHVAAWRPLTDAVISRLNARAKPVVFVLWGAKAQRLTRLITAPQHHVITAPHPAARRTYQRQQFLEARTFSKVNKVLGDAGIMWGIA